eukprot:TRINITY_DN24038_c0_g1_i1.p1 TRINITY_DN24038_c0_g1~~TRINITY_DN24038_c0_g1_i1.p1  ORF type:complete len:643 (+),score=231.86 TRINITY_DN24038_c0_g1_i1:61-1989(+)
MVSRWRADAGTAAAGVSGPTPSPPPSESLAPPLTLLTSPRDVAVTVPAPAVQAEVPPAVPTAPEQLHVSRGNTPQTRVQSAPPRPKQLEDVISEKLGIQARKYHRPLSGTHSTATPSEGLGGEALAELTRRYRRRPVTASADRGGQARVNILRSLGAALNRKAGEHCHDNFHDRVELVHLGLSLESIRPAALYTPARGRDADESSSVATTPTAGVAAEGRGAVLKEMRRYVRSARTVEERRRQVNSLQRLAEPLCQREPYLQYLGLRGQEKLQRAEERLRDVGLPHRSAASPETEDAVLPDAEITDAESAVFTDFGRFLFDLRSSAVAAENDADVKQLEDEDTVRALFARYIEQVMEDAEQAVDSQPPQHRAARQLSAGRRTEQRTKRSPDKAATASPTRPLSAGLRRGAGDDGFEPAEYLARLEEVLTAGPAAPGGPPGQHAALMNPRQKLDHIVRMVGRRALLTSTSKQLAGDRALLSKLTREHAEKVEAAADSAAPTSDERSAEEVMSDIDRQSRIVEEGERQVEELRRAPPGASRRDQRAPPHLYHQRRALQVQQGAQRVLFRMMESHTVGHFVSLERQQVRHQGHSRLLFNRAPLSMRKRILQRRQARMERNPKERSACLLFLPQVQRAPLNSVPVL